MGNSVKTILVCENCGSHNVETKMWVNVNTNEVIDRVGNGGSEDDWCGNCHAHSTIITKEEYEQTRKGN